MNFYISTTFFWIYQTLPENFVFKQKIHYRHAAITLRLLCVIHSSEIQFNKSWRNYYLSWKNQIQSSADAFFSLMRVALSFYSLLNKDRRFNECISQGSFINFYFSFCLPVHSQHSRLLLVAYSNGFCMIPLSSTDRYFFLGFSISLLSFCSVTQRTDLAFSKLFRRFLLFPPPDALSPYIFTKNIMKYFTSATNFQAVFYPSVCES